MSAPYRPLHSITPRASEMAGNQGWFFQRSRIPTRDESRAHYRTLERRRRLQALRDAEYAAAQQAINAATGLRHTMLRLHGPEVGYEGRLICGGCECDAGGLDCDGASWPCVSWTRTVNHPEGQA